MISLSTENWSIDKIETVLFDKDGTFIDLHYFWGKMTEMRAMEVINRYNLDCSNFKFLCSELGYDVESQRMLEKGITALYSRSEIIKFFKKSLEKLSLYLTIKEIEQVFDDVAKKFYLNIQDYAKPIESAIDFIKRLYNKGVRLGIVTSDSLVSTRKTLLFYDWEYLFDVVVGRENSKETKESGALTKIALEELKANPQTTVMIGDAPMDFISAKNAGIVNTILVATGQIKCFDLQKTSPFVVNSLQDICID